jgi:hypothetical protein
MIEAAVEELTPLIGTRPVCRVLGAAPATIYRRRRPPAPRPVRVRTQPDRTLTTGEREAVLEELHSERFVRGVSRPLSAKRLPGSTSRRQD